MSPPPTMVIRDADEERTLVDPRFSARDPLSDTTAFFVDRIRLSDPEPPFEGSGHVVSSSDRIVRLDAPTKEVRPPAHSVFARPSRRTMIETALVFALVGGLATVGYQQWRVAAELRETIDEMRAGRSTVPIRDVVVPATHRLAPVRAETRLKAPANQVAPDEREALEHRGASLIGSNDLSGALNHYQTLVELFPNENIFRDVVTVLKAKLRCAGSTGETSGECQ